MADFLTICQRTRELAGIGGTGPTTTVAQTGEMLRLVNWVKQSWLDIQNLQQTWNFMLTDLSFTTVNGQGDYTLANMNAPTLRKLDAESLRCEQTDLGYQNRQFLEHWDWIQFRDMYRFNTLTPGRPVRFAVDPQDKSVALAAIPDAAGYTITGRYWTQPVALVNDTDVPAMPEQFHMLIAYWALSKYAGFEAAGEVKTEAMENKAALLNALSVDQLPDVMLGGSF